MVDEPEIPGTRKSGFVGAESTPEPEPGVIESDPRLADITESVEPHGGKFLLIFTRGDHASTVEFATEPGDAVVAEYRKQADDVFDLLDAQSTTDLQDRRRPKE